MSGVPDHHSDPPDLPTLHDRPSWVNVAGRIDRSACIEVGVRDIRRLCGCVPAHFDPYKGKWIDLDRRSDPSGRRRRALPDERPAPNGHGRISTGVYEIAADELAFLHSARRSRELAGDWRSTRANVMRGAGGRARVAGGRWPLTGGRAGPSQGHPFSPPLQGGDQGEGGPLGSRSRFRLRISRNAPAAWSDDADLDPNPNKGDHRTKLIGLRTDWTQPLRLEQWTFPGRIAPAFYLVCPGGFLAKSSHEPCAMSHEGGGGSFPSPYSGGQGEGQGEGGHLVAPQDSRPKTQDSRPKTQDAADRRLPPLSTAPPGRGTKKSGCPQRVLKLLMVQCTPEEDRDAMAAQQWLDSLPPEARRSQQPGIASVLARYGPILEPRVLLCPRCLGVAYGNHPENARQSWRRRQGKPDAELTAAERKRAARAAEVERAYHRARAAGRGLDAVAKAVRGLTADDRELIEEIETKQRRLEELLAIREAAERRKW